MGCNNVVCLGPGIWKGPEWAWDGHKFVCEDDFKEEEPCLVYTFGVGKDISFEEAMANKGKRAIVPHYCLPYWGAQLT